MTELEQRIEYLENLINKINSSARYESRFDDLYKLLKKEYTLEGGDAGNAYRGSYNDDLRQTIGKQAAEYKTILKRRPVKGAPVEYESFVRNFKHDVDDELNRCKYKLNPPASGE